MKSRDPLVRIFLPNERRALLILATLIPFSFIFSCSSASFCFSIFSYSIRNLMHSLGLSRKLISLCAGVLLPTGIFFLLYKLIVELFGSFSYSFPSSFLDSSVFWVWIYFSFFLYLIPVVKILLAAICEAMLLKNSADFNYTDLTSTSLNNPLVNWMNEDEFRDIIRGVDPALWSSCRYCISCYLMSG